MLQDELFEILLVDDDQAIIDLLTRISQPLFPQATFTGLTSPQETLRYLESRPLRTPRLILLDIDLGQSVSGLSLLPQLRTHFNGLVPIIMFTSYASANHVQEAYNSGAVAYTKKPESLQGWKEYVALLKAYWYETTLLPPPELPPIQLLKRRQ